MRDLSGVTKLNVDPDLLQMRGDRVLLRRDDAEELSPGGIVLTEETKREGQPNTGEVLSFGPGEPARYTGEFIPMADDIVVGKKVVYNTYGGFEVGENCVMVSQADIIAIIREELEVDVDELEEGDLAEEDEPIA